MSEKASSLKRHVGSTRHQEGKKVLEAQKSKQRSIAVAMKKVNDYIHLKGETLPEKELVSTAKWSKRFFEHVFLSPKCSPSDHCLREEVHDSPIGPFSQGNVCQQSGIQRGAIFSKRLLTSTGSDFCSYSSTRLGEVLAVIIRFSDNEWSPKQVLVRLKALAEILPGEQRAGELIDVLATQLQVPRAHVIAAMRDGASVNGCALRAVKALYPVMFEVSSFSHTINLVGCPPLTSSSSGGSSCFQGVQLPSSVGRSALEWRSSRWWSKWEVMNQVLTQFGDIEPFLEENQDIAPRVVDHLCVLLKIRTGGSC